MLKPPSTLAVWIWAIRPRTLPLAASAIALGYGLAAMRGPVSLSVFCLALLTALLLQILSNLANDYGDAVAGTDAVDRLGPARMVGSGLASRADMLRAVILAAGLAVCSGLSLVLLAAWGNWLLLAFFLLLGVGCVAAAIMYTMGKRPYGYRGWGDIMAGLFFGPVAVLGSALLCGGISGLMWLPAIAVGLCSTAVLNINNMRDIETDRHVGKDTVAARLGLAGARRYHTGLISLTLVLWCVFWCVVRPAFLPGLLLTMPLVRSTWLAVSQAHDPGCLNAQLRLTVLSTALLHSGMAALCLWSAALSSPI